MYRLAAVLLMVLMGSVARPGAAQEPPYGPTLSFAVYRNGEPIGRHTLAFRHNGSDLLVSTSVDLAVKFLGLTAYNYSHRCEEVWKGETFQSVATQTNDNGKTYAVRARRTANGLSVERNDAREVLPGSLLPSSNWNVRQVAQSSLLNTQYGTEARVHVAPVGREKVRTASGWIDATRYHYSGDVEKDQWFDDRGRWVKSTFKAFDGSTIEYILQE